MPTMEHFLRSRGVPVKRKGDEGLRDKHITDNFLGFPCPFCGGDKNWLGWHIQKGFFTCWNCGWKSIPQVFRVLFPGENTGNLISQLELPSHYNVPVEKPTGTYSPPGGVRPLFDVGYLCQYIVERGLDPFTVRDKWGVMAIHTSPEWAYRRRLFFPVPDRNGVVVSWLTRTTADDVLPAYLAAPPSRELRPLKSLLYGAQYVSYYDTIIVCEGVFDAMRVEQNAVATFGKKITRGQFDEIAKFQRRIICFDGERGTQQQARELARALSPFPGRTDNVCLDASDPADATKEQIDELLYFAELR